MSPAVADLIPLPKKFLGAVPKTRTDLLPHYSRLVAVLETYMPDVSAGLVEIVSCGWK